MTKWKRKEFEAACLAGRRIISHDGETICAEILAGGKIFFDAKDTSLVPRFLAYGCWEPDVSVALYRILRKGTVFVDVGANFGYFSILAAMVVGREGSLHAFEANPKLVALLKRSLDTFYPDIPSTIHAKAAASQSGARVFLNVQRTEMGGSWVTAELGHYDCTDPMAVQTVALDDALPEKVDIIKIDTEGSEREIWRGMKRTMANNRHLKIVMEFYCGHDYDPPAFLEEIRADGFTIAKITFSGDCRIVEDGELLSSRDFQMLYLFRGWRRAPSLWSYAMYKLGTLYKRPSVAAEASTFYKNRGDVFCAEGYFERAIADYTRAVALPSSRGNGFRADIHYNRARTHEKLGQTMQAIDDYRRVMALDAGRMDAINALELLGARHE